MKKLISIILAIAVVFAFTAVMASADSENGVTLSIETKNIKAGSYNEDVFKVTVSGTWKNCKEMNIYMEYDPEFFEVRSTEALVDALGEVCMNLSEENKIQYAAFFNNNYSKGHIKIFECTFRAKKNGETQLRFSSSDPTVINGQTEFAVNVSGLDTIDRNEYFEFSVSDGKVKLREPYLLATDDNGLLIIPSEIKGMPVTAIADRFESYNSNIKTVVFPASVTEFGLYSLVKCENLRHIFILSDAAYIHDLAFGWVDGEKFDNRITIHGVKGSSAEKYAKEKGMFFHECSAYHETEESALADVNGDGNVTAADARLALRASAKLETLTPAQFSAADINKSLSITASDARIILRIAAKLESAYFYR